MCPQWQVFKHKTLIVNDSRLNAALRFTTPGKDETSLR
jgi:hypothetical protein